MTSDSSTDVLERNRGIVRCYFAAIATSDLEALESLVVPALAMRCAGGRGTAGVVEFHSFRELADDIRHNEGELYDNLYAFFFGLRDGLIAEIHEHLDTAYVGAVLLEPAGIHAGVEMPWLAAARRGNESV